MFRKDRTWHPVQGKERDALDLEEGNFLSIDVTK